MTIVTYAHRYKRPPRKRKPNPAALAMPAILRAGKPLHPNAGKQTVSEPLPTDRKKSAIVIIRSRKQTAIPTGLLPETEEEHKRRGAAAAAMWLEMVRRVREVR
jgi:hypothetical protein